jgi:hypothetical protein
MKSYIYRCVYSPATLYPNCNAIGALLSEICDFEQMPQKRSYIFIYIEDVEEVDRLCGLVVRVSGCRTEMYCDSCEVRTEFIYVM